MGKIWKELLLLLGRQEALHDVDSFMGRDDAAVDFLDFIDNFYK